jgi:hypothetical protein
LLAVAWTVDMVQELLAMFPEATACDVSFGTNNEKLPLALLVAKTANNETFTATWSFLPSQCRWAFHWFWAVAHPTVHGEKTLSRNRACATDGVVNLYGPFEALCGSVYPNSCHRKCVWHQYNTGMKSAGFPARSNHLQPKGRAFYHCFEKWLYSFTDDIESEDEFKESLSLLEVFLGCEEVLASDGLDKAFSTELLEYMVKSIHTADNLNKTLFYKRMSV